MNATIKERPILFSAPMVRAILEGRKTQTRRAVKRPKQVPLDYILNPSLLVDKFRTWWGEPNGLNVGYSHDCPYGQPGELLWVRETWADVHPLQIAVHRYSQDGRAGIPGPPPVSYRTIYRADGEYPPIYSLGGEPWPYRSLEPFERDGIQAFVEESRWTPSIHMPRWASRILLEVVSVRIEQLQNISEKDAISEGIEYEAGGDDGSNPVPGLGGFRNYLSKDDACDLLPQASFRSLWRAINGDDSWDANPWVWVVEFRRITP